MAVLVRDNSSSGIGELARSLAMFPLLKNQAAFQVDANKALRDQRLADVGKTQAETALLENRSANLGGLPQALETMARFNQGLPSADLAQPGQGRHVLQTPPPVSVGDFAGAQSQFLQSFPANAAQATQALLNQQSQGVRNRAEGAAQGGDFNLASVLNAISSGQAVPAQFAQNAAGSVLDRFGGGVDQANPLAVASIAQKGAEKFKNVPVEIRKLFEIPVINERTGRPETDAFTGKLVTQTNNALLDNFIQWRAQNLGVSNPFDAYRRWAATLNPGQLGQLQGQGQPVAAQEQDQGNFLTNAPGAISDAFGAVNDAGNYSITDWLSSAQPWMDLMGVAQSVEAAPAAPGNVPGQNFSAKLGRAVTEQEIQQTATNRGISVEEVRQILQIQ